MNSVEKEVVAVLAIDILRILFVVAVVSAAMIVPVKILDGGKNNFDGLTTHQKKMLYIDKCD